MSYSAKTLTFLIKAKALVIVAQKEKRDPTTHPGDAGTSPRRASVLAAVEALDDRASTADGGIGLQ